LSHCVPRSHGVAVAILLGFLGVRSERCDHPHFRPHSALAYMTPHEFTAKWHQENKVLGS
jgi:hypothetical protein